MKNKIKNSKILITGGAGFVGSHLAEELLRKGAKIFILDDFSNGRAENLEEIKNKIKIIKYDISSSFPKIKGLLKKYKFDAIFHLACFPRSLSLKDPFRDLDVNAKGMLNVLELAKINKSKVVFTSNSGIYGDPRYLPTDERHPDNPTMPYDANKLVSEYYMKIYHRIFGISITICRLAAVYGERQMVKPGWHPIIPEFTNKVFKNNKAIICWDGKQTRDLIYVKDVVQGLIKSFLANTGEEIFILGTNRETSINRIYEIICSLLGKKIEPIRKEKTPGDLRRMKLSYQKANKWLGFKPKYTLEQGIKNYINWFKVNR